MGRAQETAIANLARRAGGGPADPSWRVTLHFHPDRLVAGTPVLDAMARDGVYRSQFETGTGNGGLTAYPGGDLVGGSPRFGSAYLRLAAHTGDPLDDYVEAHCSATRTTGDRRPRNSACHSPATDGSIPA